jgi:hypothetical protein
VTREEKAAPVRALREEGHTWEEIGRMLGISSSTRTASTATRPARRPANGSAVTSVRALTAARRSTRTGSGGHDPVCHLSRGAYAGADAPVDHRQRRRMGAPVRGAARRDRLEHLPCARAKGMEWKVRRVERTGRRGPGTTIVQDHFGSWNGMLRELGHRPLDPSEHAMGRHGVTLRDEEAA